MKRWSLLLLLSACGAASPLRAQWIEEEFGGTLANVACRGESPESYVVCTFDNTEKFRSFLSENARTKRVSLLGLGYRKILAELTEDDLSDSATLSYGCRAKDLNQAGAAWVIVYPKIVLFQRHLAPEAAPHFHLLLGQSRACLLAFPRG
ncbi:hypothetical protein [Deinococcus arcticus]|uniref:Uncharacterized protein n=1 Tax=Deinococcus arcticus TaxID=2136176 RepID=A0A2T3W3S9_9DEIO|nr:hypothetical protein [Deinococcus arcticus]PTA66560.1 hypothetical protein C8263_17140 [Deinococcus arcticus]